MPDYHTNALNEALQHLSDSLFLPSACAYLTANASALNTELNETVLAEIPAFSASRNPDVLPDLAQHGPEHTDEILRLLGGGPVRDFDFVRKHAQRRAAHRFPLEATLHAYRCGHKVYSRWVRKAMLAAVSWPEDTQQAVADIADFTIEYTDAISTIAASNYVSHTRLLADVAGDQRAELLTILLDGYDESDGRVAKILRDAGYLDARQSFCVALAQPVDPTEMINPDRARRLVDSIDKILDTSPSRRVIDIRHNKVTIVFSDICRTSGWTAPHAALAERVTSELMMVGNAVLIGVSNDVPSTSQIPTAHREAQLALELADVTRRVVQVAELPAQRLMLHFAGEDFQRVLPAWASTFFRADQKVGGSLVATLRAYANADMNVLKAAEQLSVHPNTVYSRLQKILDITGLEARSYHALTELLIVADSRDFNGSDPLRAYNFKSPGAGIAKA